MKKNNNFEEIPKHKKKTGSSISKSAAKTKHKHEYLECLIRYPFSFAGKTLMSTYLSSYCTICGKIGDTLSDGILVEDPDIRSDRNLLYEKYKDILPVFELSDVSEKYVILKK